MMNAINKIFILALIFLSTTKLIFAQENLVQNIDEKTEILNELILEANKKNIDTKREECVIWMAEQFSIYADWDAKNISENVKHFKSYEAKKGSPQDFSRQADELAKNLPVYERKEILLMLSDAITELTAVINGEIIRPEVNFFDWSAIGLKDNQYISEENRSLYIHDYFTKPRNLNNDYCGYLDRASISINSLINEKEVNPTTISRLQKSQTGMAGYVMLWHGFPPKWSEAKEPNIKDGMRLFTLYDIDNPLVRKSWERVIKQTVPLFRDKPASKMGYILSNEPHWFTHAGGWATGGVSGYTKDKFRVWLKERHKKIDILNTLWGTNFKSFKEVDFTVPFDSKTTLGTAQGYDWQRFNMDRVTDWFTMLHSNIKKSDPESTTHIKLMPDCWVEDLRDHGLDFEALTELTEVSGNDAQLYKELSWENHYPWWKDRYALCWSEMMAYDFFKSVKPNQPIFNSEGHYLSTSRYRDLYMKPNYVRTAFWLSTMHGMNSCLSWFWPRDIVTGAPEKSILNANSAVDNAMSKAYPASVVHQPRVANEVAQVYMNLNSYADEVARFQSMSRPIRIFYSETSAINNKGYMTKSIFPLYESLNFEGYAIGFATKNIIEKQDNKTWEVIIVIETESVTDCEFNALQRYLDNGGAVIIDRGSLSKDEYGRARNEKLKAANGELILVNETSKMKSVAMSLLKTQKHRYVLEEENSSIGKGCEWRTITNDNGETFISIINIGNSDAALKIKDTKTGKYVESIDAYTGKTVNKTFSLPSEEVMLLKIDCH